MSSISRRNFVAGAVGSSAALWLAQRSMAASGLAPIYTEVERRHDEALAQLQEWAAAWRHYVLQTVIEAYRVSVSPFPRLANSDQDFEILMRCLRLEHALAEVQRHCLGDAETMLAALELLLHQTSSAPQPIGPVHPEAR